MHLKSNCFLYATYHTPTTMSNAIRVKPVPAELVALQPKDWAKKLAEVTQYTIDKYEVPDAYSIGLKANATVCCAISCWPCCLWSTFWRVAACPIQCVTNGMGYMCSNNNCTTVSDACVNQMCTEIHKKFQMPDIHLPDITKLSEQEAKDMQRAFDIALQLFDANIYDWTNFEKLPKKEQDIIYRKRRAQNQYIDNVLKAVHNFVGGSTKYMYIVPQNAPDVIKQAMAKIAPCLGEKM